MTKRRLWLLASAFLLLVAVLLMHGEESTEEDVVVEAPRIPRYPTATERQRQRQRARLVKQSTPDASTGEAPAEFHLDPMFVALSNPHGSVVEASALLHSEVGQAVYGCLASRAGFQEDLESLEQKFGMKLNDLDRIGFDGDVVVVSGLRKGDPEIEGEWASIGQGARVHNNGEESIGLYDDHLMVLGPQEAVAGALDRLDRKEPAPNGMGSDIAYGEMYGRAGSELLERILPPAGEQGSELRDAVKQVDFHFDVQSDVAMYFEVRGTDAESLDDVAKSIGGALSMARVKAELDGDDRLKALLAFAKVSNRHDGFFSLDIVLPKSFVLDRFEACGEDALERNEVPPEASRPRGDQDVPRNNNG